MRIAVDVKKELLNDMKSSMFLDGPGARWAIFLGMRQGTFEMPACVRYQPQSRVLNCELGDFWVAKRCMEVGLFSSDPRI